MDSLTPPIPDARAPSAFALDVFHASLSDQERAMPPSNWDRATLARYISASAQTVFFAHEDARDAYGKCSALLCHALFKSGADALRARQTFDGTRDGLKTESFILSVQRHPENPAPALGALPEAELARVAGKARQALAYLNGPDSRETAPKDIPAEVSGASAPKPMESNLSGAPAANDANGSGESESIQRPRGSKSDRAPERLSSPKTPRAIDDFAPEKESKEIAKKSAFGPIEEAPPPFLSVKFKPLWDDAHATLALFDQMSASFNGSWDEASKASAWALAMFEFSSLIDSTSMESNLRGLLDSSAGAEEQARMSKAGFICSLTRSPLFHQVTPGAFSRHFH